MKNALLSLVLCATLCACTSPEQSKPVKGTVEGWFLIAEIAQPGSYSILDRANNLEEAMMKIEKFRIAKNGKGVLTVVQTRYEDFAIWVMQDGKLQTTEGVEVKVEQGGH